MPFKVVVGALDGSGELCVKLAQLSQVKGDADCQVLLFFLTERICVIVADELVQFFLNFFDIGPGVPFFCDWFEDAGESTQITNFLLLLNTATRNPCLIMVRIVQQLVVDGREVLKLYLKTWYVNTGLHLINTWSVHFYFNLSILFIQNNAIDREFGVYQSKKLSICICRLIVGLQVDN